MKRYIFIMSALAIVSILGEQLKINVYPTVNYTQRFDIVNTNKSGAIPMAAVSTPVSATPVYTASQTTVLTNNPISGYSLLKKSCLVGSFVVAVSYLSFLAYLSTQSYRLDEDGRWYNWKHEVPLAALRELPSEQIIQALNASLHKKYANSAKDICTIAAALHKEEQELKQIIDYCSWIREYKIDFLFFKQGSILELAKQKLERLLFIKEVLTKHITFIMGQPTATNEGLL